MQKLFHALGCIALLHAVGLAQAPQGDIQPPASLRNIAATLQTMGRADLATRLIRDFRSRRVVLGTPGSNAMTSPPLIVPGVTTRAGNIMTLDQSLGPVCDTHATDRNPVNSGTLSWALTVVHEYVHMGQDNPQRSPRFENPAWRATVEENQRWMRRIMSQVTDAELHMPSGQDKIARLNQLANTLNELRNIHNTTLNDLREEIAAGSVGADQDWPTLDLGSTKDLGQVAVSCNTLVDTFLRNTRDGIARFQRELGRPSTAGPTAPAASTPARAPSLFEGAWPRVRRQHTDCSFSADSSITITTDAAGAARVNSDFLGATRGQITGRTLTFQYGLVNGVPSGSATLTLSADGLSFNGTFSDNAGHRGTLVGHR